MIDFECPSCGVRKSLPDEVAGRKARCRCGAATVIEPQRTSFDRLTGFDESPSESFEPREIEGDRDEGFGLSSEADLGESDGDPRSSPASRAESRSEKSVPHSLGWV